MLRHSGRDDESSVIPAGKPESRAVKASFHEAVQSGAERVTIWGTGTPRREFIHVDDMAAACVHVMTLDPAVYRAHTRPLLSHINVGTGQDVTILELAETIVQVTGFGGELVFDPSKPDGTPRKLLDVSRLKALGCGEHWAGRGAEGCLCLVPGASEHSLSAGSKVSLAIPHQAHLTLFVPGVPSPTMAALAQAIEEEYTELDRSLLIRVVSAGT